ncbi:MAG: SMI1/KNR4 family protein [Treponema sp.]|jgi:hypothetical protein|nr:SMI1/KNR4 family protein [Treponema sp.]
MGEIINTIAGLRGLSHGKGASQEAISEAGKRLGLSFADDYQEYLKKYGVLSARHIELSGIIDAVRLNVADVTEALRKDREIPDDMYVIEDTAIEGIFILQNKAGEIYESQKDRGIKKIYSSLSDYIGSK